MRLLLALLWYLSSVVGHEEVQIDVPIEWKIQGSLGIPPPDEILNVGDTITFNWDGDHNVFMHPKGNCVRGRDTVRVGSTTGAKYTVTEADIGKDIPFACQISDHCQQGLRITIPVANWQKPPNGDTELPSESMAVDDTIAFRWRGDHNVYIHPQGDCSKSNSKLVGNESPAKYTFTAADDGKNVVSASEMNDDCEHGMIKRVTVKPRVVFCFSGDDRVQVENKGSMEMAALEIGDKVLVSGNKYEPVYSFGHRDAGVSAEYLEIHSDSTNDPLKLSRDHMILAGGEHWVPAAGLRVGGTLTKGDGSVVVVTKIQDVKRKGIFAPFTASGSIVVNGIVASNFIAFQVSEYLKIGEFATPFSFQWLAHTFESGHRLACSSGFVACDQETYTDSGVSHWVDTPHQVTRWLLQQHAAVTLILLVPLVLVFRFLSVLEHPGWLFTLLGAVMLARSFRVKKTQQDEGLKPTPVVSMLSPKWLI